MWNKYTKTKTFCSKSKPQFSFCKVCYFHVKVVSNEGESMLVLFKFKIKVHILGQIIGFWIKDTYVHCDRIHFP